MRRLLPVVALVAIGAAWGLTLPLLRVATSTGHGALGLLAWQSLVMAAALLPLARATGRPLPPILGNLGLFAAVAVFGAVLPGYFTFLTAAHLPAGVRAIVIALVPVFVLPMALAMGFERASLRRSLGVLLGALAVVMMGLPGAGGTGGIGLGMLLLALVAPASGAGRTAFTPSSFSSARRPSASCWPGRSRRRQVSSSTPFRGDARNGRCLGRSS